MIAIECIESEPGFHALRGEWDSLHVHTASPSIFRSWSWQHAWWRHFGAGRDLRIFTAREAGQLVGIAPLCVERADSIVPARALRFLGTEWVSSEYLDVIAAPGLEAPVCAAVLTAIEEKRDWDLLALSDLLHDSVVLVHWEPMLRARRFDVDRRVSQEVPYRLLPKSAEALRGQWGHSLRGAVARATRKLESAGYRVRFLSEPGAIEPALDRLFELHAARWGSKRLPGKFRDERVRAFHRDIAGTLGREGAIRLVALANGTTTVGLLYALELGGVFSYYQSGFEPSIADLRAGEYSPGLVLIARAMEDAAERGLAEFDFLRGDEPYKRRWTDALRRTWSLTAVRPGAVSARAGVRMTRGLRAARSRAKRAIHRSPRSAAPTGRTDQGIPPRPIRVLHVLQELQLAGMEYGVIKVVNCLPGSIDAGICCLREQAEATKPVLDPRVRVLELRQPTSRNYGLIQTLASVLRRERIDVVHTHNWQSYLYGVLGARLAGVPVVIHGEHGRETERLSAKRILANRVLAPLVTRFVAVSDDLAREIATRWRVAPDRIEAIPNGVDLARFTAGRDDTGARHELRLEPDDEIVISVGGIRRVKDHATLIRAFARVGRERPRAQLLLVGADCDAPLHAELTELAESLEVADRVRFLGVRHDVPSLLAAGDVYVNSSRFEGMSNTILEAMAAGKPVVATAIVGNAALIEEGVTGCLVPAGDDSALAERIGSLLSDTARGRALGAAGRAYVERDHSMQTMVARYARLYESTFDRWWGNRAP